MALPLSRNRNYSNATPVSPADLNDIQDSIIGAWHGELWVPINMRAGSGHVPSSSGTAPGFGGFGNALQFLAAAPVGSVYSVGLSFADGTRIKELKWVATSSTGTEDVTLTLHAAQWSGATQIFGGGSVGATVMTNIPASAGNAWTAYSLVLAPYTIVHGTQLWLEFYRHQNNGGFIKFEQMYALVDRP